MSTEDNNELSVQPPSMRLGLSCKLDRVRNAIEKEMAEECTYCLSAKPEELREAFLRDAVAVDAIQPQELLHSYSEVERWANIYTHAFGIPASLYAFIKLTEVTNNSRQWWVCAFYSFALLMLYLASSLYHLFSKIELDLACRCRLRSYKWRPYRELFSVIDRMMIYVSIAASYTPWLVFSRGEVGILMTQAIWTATCTGMLWTFYHHYCLKCRFPNIENWIIVMIATVPALVIIGFYSNNDYADRMVVYSGTAYIMGLVFFHSDGIIPGGHAIWHMFVNLGVLIHTIGIHSHLSLEKARLRELELAKRSWVSYW